MIDCYYLIHNWYSIFTNWPIYILSRIFSFFFPFPWFNLESYLAFNYHFSIVSFNLEVSKAFFYFMTLVFLKSHGSAFVEYSSVWTSLMFPQYWYCYAFLAEDCRSDVEPFSAHHIKSHVVSDPFDFLVKVVTVRFLHYKPVIFCI